MSNDKHNKRGRQPTPWYSHPAAQATYAILGVSIALVALIMRPPIWPTAEIEQPNKRDEALRSADSTTLTNTGEVVRLSAETDFSTLIRGQTIRLDESVQTIHPVYIVGESVTLTDNATIRAPHIWIFSDSITGGSLDVSGADGTIEEKDGAYAGTVYIVAQSVEGVNIRAIGGNGYSGDKGHRGSNGQDGDCAGFGGWEPAQSGGDGGPGGTGGRGGYGGSIRIVYGASHSQRDIIVRPGTGGSGGEGGDPGSGGDGCAGLGGAQSDASSGAYGPRGPNGADGAPGTVVIERKENLVPTSLTWLRDRSDRLTVATLQHVMESEQRNSAP